MGQLEHLGQLEPTRILNGGWQLAAGGSGVLRGFDSRFKNSRLAKNGGWQLAAGGSAFHRGRGIFKIQEFNISKEPNGCLWPDAKSQRPDLITPSYFRYYAPIHRLMHEVHLHCDTPFSTVKHCDPKYPWNPFKSVKSVCLCPDAQSASTLFKSACLRSCGRSPFSPYLPFFGTLLPPQAAISNFFYKIL